MQVSVNLQAPFSYSIYYIIIILIIIFSITLYFFFSKKKKENKQIVKIKEINQDDKKIIKNKYIDKLKELEIKLDKNQINVRKAYQELSNIIRYFVYELTNIKVQNYTLKEIQEINMPILYELIKEYYVPEFAKKSLGDIKSSIEKTRKVIDKWN